MWYNFVMEKLLIKLAMTKKVSSYPQIFPTSLQRLSIQQIQAIHRYVILSWPLNMVSFSTLISCLCQWKILSDPALVPPYI